MSIIFKDAGELPMPVVKVCMRSCVSRGSILRGTWQRPLVAHGAVDTFRV